MAEFKKGNVVQVKSGGPRMTVSNVGDYSDTGGPDEGVVCVWFEVVKGVQQPQDKLFDASVLKLLEE